jgi:putative hemolysin
VDPIAIDLLVIAVLVLVNAAFAGTELAVVSLRRSQLVRLAETHGRRGRTLLALSEQPTRFLSTIQVGITLAGFLASATAAVSLAEPLEPALAFLGDAAGIAALITVTVVLAFVSLVFGELVPKRVAMRRPEQWALAAAPPVAFIARVARPLVWLLAKTTDVVARLVGGGGSNGAEVDLLTEEEVLDVIATETEFTPARRELLQGVLDLEQRTAREVLVPRRDVLFLTADMTAADAARALAVAGHSRAPVCSDDEHEELIGIVVLGALVAAAPTAIVETIVDPVTYVPENARVQDVIALLQRTRRQLAVVADEHGRMVGIVSMEDLLEEIVGELYDELDRELEPTDPRGYTALADGSFELPGTFPVHDLVDLGLPVPDDVGAATVAGLLMDALGSVPAAGETVTCGELLLEAIAVDATVVAVVRVRRT